MIGTALDSYHTWVCSRCSTVTTVASGTRASMLASSQLSGLPTLFPSAISIIGMGWLDSEVDPGQGSLPIQSLWIQPSWTWLWKCESERRFVKKGVRDIGQVGIENAKIATLFLSSEACLVLRKRTDTLIKWHAIRPDRFSSQVTQKRPRVRFLPVFS